MLRLQQLAVLLAAATLFAPSAVAQLRQQGQDEDLAEHQAFDNLLKGIPDAALHKSLHGHHPAFQDGVYDHERTAAHVLHDEDPTLATKVVEAARQNFVKRQGGDNNTIVVSASVSVPPILTTTDSSPATTTSTEQPTTTSIVSSPPPTSSDSSSDTSSDSSTSPPSTSDTQPVTSSSQPITSSGKPLLYVFSLLPMSQTLAALLFAICCNQIARVCDLDLLGLTTVRFEYNEALSTFSIFEVLIFPAYSIADSITQITSSDL